MGKILIVTFIIICRLFSFRDNARVAATNINELIGYNPSKTNSIFKMDFTFFFFFTKETKSATEYLLDFKWK